MDITQIDGNIVLPKAAKPTQEQLQNEYDYMIAESITKKLLEKGFITADEFNRIMEKNRESFSPFIEGIMT